MNFNPSRVRKWYRNNSTLGSCMVVRDSIPRTVGWTAHTVVGGRSGRGPILPKLDVAGANPVGRSRLAGALRDAAGPSSSQRCSLIFCASSSIQRTRPPNPGAAWSTSSPPAALNVSVWLLPSLVTIVMSYW